MGRETASGPSTVPALRVVFSAPSAQRRSALVRASLSASAAITGSTTSRTRAPEAACPTWTSVEGGAALAQVRLAVGLAPQPQEPEAPGAPPAPRGGRLARRSLPPALGSPVPSRERWPRWPASRGRRGPSRHRPAPDYGTGNLAPCRAGASARWPGPRWEGIVRGLEGLCARSKNPVLLRDDLAICHFRFLLLVLC
jgi:hypothetical protein